MRPRLQKCVSKNGWILLANSNQWHFNNLVKKPCHETHCRCPHRLHLSFQSSRSCALPSIKVLKDKDLEFANSIWPYDPLESACLRFTQSTWGRTPPQSGLVPRHGVSLTSYPRQDRFCCALPLQNAFCFSYPRMRRVLLGLPFCLPYSR